MKQILLFFTLLLSLSVQAQTADEGRISIKAVMPDGDIPAEAARNMETRLQRVLTNAGFADNGYAERFVLTAKVDVTNKDIAPTTPARVSEKMDITFIVGDVVENKIYSTATVSVAGIGTNENKALISAFTKVNPNMKQLADMLTEAKEKIVDFYTNHCTEQQTAARTLASMGKYDEAISHMLAVPNVCADCYEQCQSLATTFYQQKIDAEALAQLEKARNAWMQNSNADGAAEVAACLNTISPYAASYKDAVKLRNTVAAKLKADEQREWNFQMLQYKDAQTNKQAVIKAARDVAVAWASHRPSTVVKVIRGWW